MPSRTRTACSASPVQRIRRDDTCRPAAVGNAAADQQLTPRRVRRLPSPTITALVRPCGARQHEQLVPLGLEGVGRRPVAREVASCALRHASMSSSCRDEWESSSRDVGRVIGWEGQHEAGEWRSVTRGVDRETTDLRPLLSASRRAVISPAVTLTSPTALYAAPGLTSRAALWCYPPDFSDRLLFLDPCSHAAVSRTLAIAVVVVSTRVRTDARSGCGIDV